MAVVKTLIYVAVFLDSKFLGIQDLAHFGYDSMTYFAPWEQYIKEGTYRLFNGLRWAYAGRMPHYGLPYVLMRSIGFTITQSAFVVVLAQVVLSAMSVLLLGYTITRMRIVPKYLACCFVILAACSLLTIKRDFTIGPESFTVSALVFAFCAVLRLKADVYNLAWWWLLGGALAIAVVLRPYLLLLYLVFGVAVLFLRFKGRSNVSRKAFWAGTLPLALLLVPWTVRNSFYFNRPVVFQEDMVAGYNYSAPHLALRRIFYYWGTSHTSWDMHSAGCYFEPNTLPCYFDINKHPFPSGYSASDIAQIRTDYVRFHNAWLQKDAKVLGMDSASTDLQKRIHNYAADFARDFPFRAYVLSHIKRVVFALWGSFTYYLPSNSSYASPNVAWLMQKVKYAQAGYYLFMTLGLFFALYLAIRTKNRLWIIVFGAFLLTYIALAMTGMNENRVYMVFEPLLLLAGMSFLNATIIGIRNIAGRFVG
jgi:hypothetical protein